MGILTREKMILNSKKIQENDPPKIRVENDKLEQILELEPVLKPLSEIKFFDSFYGKIKWNKSAKLITVNETAVFSEDEIIRLRQSGKSISECELKIKELFKTAIFINYKKMEFANE